MSQSTRAHTITPPTDPTTLPTIVPTLLLDVGEVGVPSMDPLNHFLYTAAFVVMIEVGTENVEVASVASVFATMTVVGNPVLKDVSESVNSYCWV